MITDYFTNAYSKMLHKFICYCKAAHYAKDVSTFKGRVES